MSTDWVGTHLQEIRTLMERAALYRRALSPVSLWVGLCGCAGAAACVAGGWREGIGFMLVWMGAATAALAGTLAIVRIQALRAREPFWSPPARRVTQAALPGLASAAGLTAALLIWMSRVEEPEHVAAATRLAAALWLVFYGTALHAAGFFMRRGLKLAGWIFVALGAAYAMALAVAPQRAPSPLVVMGGAFGGAHLLYAAYLWITRRDADS